MSSEFDTPFGFMNNIDNPFDFEMAALVTRHREDKTDTEFNAAMASVLTQLQEHGIDLSEDLGDPLQATRHQIASTIALLATETNPETGDPLYPDASDTYDEFLAEALVTTSSLSGVLSDDERNTFMQILMDTTNPANVIRVSQRLQENPEYLSALVEQLAEDDLKTVLFEDLSPVVDEILTTIGVSRNYDDYDKLIETILHITSVGQTHGFDNLPDVMVDSYRKMIDRFGLTTEQQAMILQVIGLR